MKTLQIALALALATTAVACAERQPMILEAKDVQSFQTSASHLDEHIRIHLTGLAFHSALAIEKLEQRVDGEALRLTIILVPARPGLSGTFDYEVEVPSTVTSVTFGESQEVIWRRGTRQ